MEVKLPHECFKTNGSIEPLLIQGTIYSLRLSNFPPILLCAKLISVVQKLRASMLRHLISVNIGMVLRSVMVWTFYHRKMEHSALWFSLNTLKTTKKKAFFLFWMLEMEMLSYCTHQHSAWRGVVLLWFLNTLWNFFLLRLLSRTDDEFLC